MIDNTRGILAMSASVVAFVFNDALVKLVTETMPVMQAIGVRGIFATLWCAFALAVTGTWRYAAGALDPRTLLRGLLEAAAAFLFFIGLLHIPFAVASAINLSTPLILTALAVLVLKEDVGWRRWTAVIVGFAGVLMVIQPRPGDLDAHAALGSWLVFASSALAAVRDLLGRFLPKHLSTLVVSFATATIVAVTGCSWALIEGWQPMTWRALGLLVLSSLLLALGYQLVLFALRSGGELSVMASFRYSSVLWALAIGWVMWGEVPNSLALCGIAVIVAAGLYILHRDRVRR